jgi:glycosyltransferase involved in cell wall biosynthesis
MGMHYNANFGLQLATGDLITSLGGDDRWLPQKLELEWQAIQGYPDARVAYSNVYTIDDEGNRTGIWYDGRGPAPPSGDVFIEVFSRRFFPNTRSIFRNQLMYRSALDEVGHYDEDIPIHIDWDLKIRLAAKFHVAYSGEALVEYRVHDRGVHNSPPELLYKSILAVYEKNLPLLNQRSQIEQILVKCHIESLLALRQNSLPLSERVSYYSARNVYLRNRILLDQLPKSDRVALEKELAPVFTQLARRLAKEALESGDRKLALKYWLESLLYTPGRFDFRLAAQVMLPRWAYQELKPVYRALCGIRR